MRFKLSATGIFAGTLSVIVAIALFLFMVPISTSSADTYQVKWGKSLGESHKYLVVQRAQDGTVGVCTGDMQGGVGAELPDSQTFTQVRGAAGEAVARNFSTHISRRDYNTVVSAQNSAQLAALLSLFSEKAKENSETAQSYAYAVAGLLTSGRFEGMGVPPDNGELSQKMLQVADQWAGPYSVEGEFDLSDQASIANLGVKGRHQSWLSDLTMEINLEGAQFADGTKQASLKTTDHALSIPITTKPGTKVSARLRVSDLPANYFNVIEHPRFQDLVIPGKIKTSVETRIAGIDQHRPFQPKITTSATVSDTGDAVKGALISDVVEVSATPEEWVKSSSGEAEPVILSGTLYWLGNEPVARSEVIPNDAEVVVTRKVEIRGTAQGKVVHREQAKIKKPGFYSWVWQIDPKAQTSDLVKSRMLTDVHEDIGIPSQTVQLQAPQPSPEPSVEVRVVPSPEPSLEATVVPSPEPSVEVRVVPSPEPRIVPNPMTSPEPSGEPVESASNLAQTGSSSRYYLSLSLLLAFIGSLSLQLKHHHLTKSKK